MGFRGHQLMNRCTMSEPGDASTSPALAEPNEEVQRGKAYVLSGWMSEVGCGAWVVRHSLRPMASDRISFPADTYGPAPSECREDRDLLALAWRPEQPGLRDNRTRRAARGLGAHPSSCLRVVRRTDSGRLADRPPLSGPQLLQPCPSRARYESREPQAWCRRTDALSTRT